MIELIPAIDLIDGKCVRLSQGVYESKKVYRGSPLDVARELEDHGIRRLHLVDLDGAASHHIVNYRVLEQITSHTRLVVDFGGGVKSDDDLAIAFECGAQMVTGGSIAVRRPDLFVSWLQRYGAERIILGADVKDGRVAVDGWTNETTRRLFDFLTDYQQAGVKKVICTDIACDGMLQGPSVALYREVLQRHPHLSLTASGGVGGMDDIRALDEIGVPGVIFGKALYEGRITWSEIEHFLLE